MHTGLFAKAYKVSIEQYTNRSTRAALAIQCPTALLVVDCTVASHYGVNVIFAAREPTVIMMILYHRVGRKPSWLWSRMVGVLKTGLVRATAGSD